MDALNFGLAEARALFVARMDADDRMHPERLAAQIDFFERFPALDLVATRVELFPGSKVRQGYREYVNWQNECLNPQDVAQEIYIESPFAHPSVMFRRHVIQELGGYRNGPFPEDYDLWLRLHASGRMMARVPRVLLFWRESRGRLSRNDPRYSREAFDRLRARYLSTDPALLGILEEKRPLAIWGAGRKTRRRAELLLERLSSFSGLPRVWIDIDSRKIGNRLRGIPVVSPDWLREGRKAFVLVYVNNHGARKLIGERLKELGFCRGSDYLMVG